VRKTGERPVCPPRFALQICPITLKTPAQRDDECYGDISPSILTEAQIIAEIAPTCIEPATSQSQSPEWSHPSSFTVPAVRSER